MSTADATAEDTRTKGAQSFDAFMGGDNPAKAPITGRMAALALGITEPTIGHYRRGIYVPDWPMRWVIQAWSGDVIKDFWWCDSAELARLELAETIAPYGKTKAPARARKATR